MSDSDLEKLNRYMGGTDDAAAFTTPTSAVDGRHVENEALHHRLRAGAQPRSKECDYWIKIDGDKFEAGWWPVVIMAWHYRDVAKRQVANIFIGGNPMYSNRIEEIEKFCNDALIMSGMARHGYHVANTRIVNEDWLVADMIGGA